LENLSNASHKMIVMNALVIAAEAQKTLNWGSVTLPSRFLLAPLAGYTNLAFRLAVRELGGLGLATTDLVNARALLRGSDRALDLVKTCPADRPMAVQIYGADAAELRDAAQWLENYGVSAVDINMGCPVHKVVRGGGGSALMCDPAKSVELVREVVEAVKIPVTVKMRLGWDDASWSAPFFAREFEQVGVAGVTIHGRTREQGFGGNVNRDGIRAVVEAVERIPVIGNGDVRNAADVERMLEETGCAGVAIGRGALLNPYLFVQIRRWELFGVPGPLPTYEQRLDFMHRHFHLQVEERGERIGCITFRKIANWYSRLLKPSNEQHRALMLIESVESFDRIIEALRDRGPPPFYHRHEDIGVPVPGGPNERW
jgi:tRNA-dihydrouridine synthase B